MSSDKLDDAIQLIKSGNKPAAVSLLKEVLQANPRDEDAWLWLYSCVEQAEQKKFCLKKALEINPNNQPAQNALRKLTNLASQPVEEAAPGKATPSQPTAKSEPESERRKKRPWGWVLGCMGALALVCVASFLYLTQTGQISSLAADLALFPSATLTPSPTLTATATATFTPSPAPTFTSTVTPRPSWTPVPASETPTPTPTIAPFTPGNPTATPLGSEITDPNFKKGVAAFYKTFNDRVDDYEPVVKLMSAAIAANPELAPPYQYRGIAYWYLGDCVAGMADEEKALSINPNHAVAWADHGLLNECLGNEIGMLQDYQKALSLDPSLAWVHHNLGVYYYGKGNYEKSLEEYSLSVEIDPKYSRSWSGKSEALTKLGRLDECITYASKALEVYRKEWLAYSDRGYCELSQGDFIEAIKDYKVYIANGPEDSSVVYNLGIAYGRLGNVYYDSGRYGQAIENYKLAVSLIPGDAHSHCRLAFSYFEIKQYQNTLDAAKASTAISGCTSQKLLEIEARSSYALGDYKAGIEYMNQALAQGLYPLGYYYRGILYQAAERKAEAIQDLKQFLATGYTGEEIADAKARLAKLEP